MSDDVSVDTFQRGTEDNDVSRPARLDQFLKKRGRDSTRIKRREPLRSRCAKRVRRDSLFLTPSEMAILSR